MAGDVDEVHGGDERLAHGEQDVTGDDKVGEEELFEEVTHRSDFREVFDVAGVERVMAGTRVGCRACSFEVA